MLPRLEQHRAPATNAEAGRARHLLVVLPKTEKIGDLARVPLIETLRAALDRRQKKLSELVKSPFTTDAENGALVAWAMDDAERSTFERHTTLRKAMQLVLAECPREVTIAVFGEPQARAAAAELATYVAWVNGIRLPVR
jgi:leucyl aminopeptidase